MSRHETAKKKVRLMEDRAGQSAEEAIGILMLDTHFPRIPGDIGNPDTFPFPVRYHRVPRADAARVVRTDAQELLPAFAEGARALEKAGVCAITTSCGFLARFQRELAAAVRVPVATSALLVPLVHRMLAPDRTVGILTFDARALGRRELEAAGIGAEIPVAIAGMEGTEFARVILEDRPYLDVEAAQREHVRAAEGLCRAHPEVGALVLECTNMPPYRDAIRRATGRPVFDLVHLLTLIRAAAAPEET
jgi:hypothetical protein